MPNYGGYMIFYASKKDLQTAASIVSRAVPSHTTMTILQNILLEAGNGEIILTASDTELDITTRIPAVVEKRGNIAVDAKMFSDMIRKLPEEEVRIETTENLQVLLTCGSAHFKIGGMNGDEFPERPMIERDESVTISQLSLKSIIQDTIFSVAVNENNKIMTGELFEIRGDILRVVALDGHRIAIRRIALKGSYSDRKVIVPGKTLLDVSRILNGEMDEIVNIYFTPNHIVFEMPGTIVVSRLIDGEYFNIDQMISNDYDLKLTINRSVLMDAVDRALLFVRENDKKPIIMEIEDNSLKLSIDTPQGSMKEEMETVKEGKDLVIGFNPRFILDALKAISDEQVTLYMMNAKAPCFIRDEDMSYTYLILPVNFNRN